MLMGMYGLSEDVTLMGMLNYLDKNMTSTTYAGGAGTNVLGQNATGSSGWGDTQIGAMFKLWNNHVHKVHANLLLSLPTGSIDETDEMLMPNGMRMTMRMPYSMQLGTGTYDLHPALTYTGYAEKWGWGAQAKGEIRLEDENNQGYAWGDKYSLNAWGGYKWNNWLGTTLHASVSTQEEIDGIDSQIVMPTQAADPDNYGGELVELGLGVNLRGTKGVFKNHAVHLEFTTPVYQDVNGIQLERDYTATAQWRVSF